MTDKPAALHDPAWNAATWNQVLAALPESHVLQSWEWGQFKAGYGWSPAYHAWKNATGQVCAAALILRRNVPVGGFGPRLNVLYVPKGPVLQDWQDVSLRQRVLGDMGQFARQTGAIFIKIDPDVRLGVGEPGEPGAQEFESGAVIRSELIAAGWRYSGEQIQFRNTVVIDLAADEAELLNRMKQKTRYNVRLAQKKGVIVRIANVAELDTLYKMYAETSLRDGFVIRNREYYLNLWQSFMQAGLVEPLIAEVSGEPVAGVIIFRFAQKAWYLYGMSRAAHRELMPNYLLQWEAMRRARQAGCLAYDLWGAPEEFTETDSLWGVYRFKRGLGGQVERTLGAYDLPVRPLYYTLYTQILPRMLAVMRRRGVAQTRSQAAL